MELFTPTQPWFRTSETERDLPLLLCFPWAGGVANDFAQLKACLRCKFETHGVLLPGRGRRTRDAKPSTLEALAESFVDDAMHVISLRRVWLFGHSMGADLAMLVAQAMERLLKAGPERVVLSSLPGPIVGQMRGTSHLWSEDEFYKFLKADPRIPPVFFEPGNLSVLGPLVRQDYACSDAHVYRDLRAISCPITVLAGSHDQISTDELLLWRVWTQSTFSLRLIPGGHNCLQTHPISIARLLLEDLEFSDLNSYANKHN